MGEVISNVNKLGGFSWSDLISLIALIGSWITIFLLLKERADNTRPYLQISFELVKSNLTCVVIRNVGKVPLVLSHIHYEEEFIEQLPEKERMHLNNNNIHNLTIFPGGKWIVCLGVIVPTILKKFNKKTLKINYEYKKINGWKKYTESEEIDFQQYSRFLVYISEIDELREVDKKIEKNTKELEKRLKNIETSIVQYCNVGDTSVKTFVNGYIEEKGED